MGIDSTQTEFDTIRGNGPGEKTHTLTEAEIPSHYHPLTLEATTFEQTDRAALVHRLHPKQQRTQTAGSLILQPYKVVYMWLRTA